MKKFVNFRFIVTLVLAVFANVVTYAQDNVIDEVVWVVGDEAILKSDVEEARMDALYNGRRFEGDPYCVIPEEIAVQKLFLHQAKLDSIEVSEAEIIQRVDMMTNMYIQQIGSKEKMEEYFNKTATQIRETLRENARDGLTVQKMQQKLVGDIKVTPAEVRRYFKDLPQDSIPYIPTQVEVQIITLQPKIPIAEIEDVKRRLRDYNCLNPKKQVEAQELLCAVIEAIIAVKENFKADYIIDILQGRETSEVQAHLHEDLEVFGSGMGEEDKTWNAVIRQALIGGYLSKDVENYGLLKVTEEGHKFLKKPKSFKITEDNDFEETEEEVPARGGGSCAVDPALYSMLKDLRKKLSKKLEVPPYVIFQDPSLEAMATIYPVTLDELQNIPGVGAGKAKRYGEEFCKLIKRHCEENEIERPEDLRVRTVANKSKMKVAIIQAIDRKVALDDIALSKGIEFGELLDEVEAIVYSGTKLNIDYFLEEIMDEDHMLDIYDYFKESTTDKIDDALDELGDEFTEEEVRLVRIKFISEMAN